MGRPREGAEGGSSSTPKPRNTMRICLDGENGREVVPSYQEGIGSIVEWCLANGIVKDVSSIFGPNTKVCTTPPTGTFHLELEYSGRYLEVVINGRDLYVMGWRGPNGSYEIKEDTENSQNDRKSHNYMLGEDIRPVSIGKNYRYLAPNGEVGDTKLGIYNLRRAFDALFDYRGGSPRRIEEPIGIIAVYICEATRYPFVHDIVCASFIDDSVSRLRQVSVDLLWLNRWSHFSGELMEHIDCLIDGKIPPAIKCRGIEVQCAEDIIPMIRVLHIDGYNKGEFAHDTLPKVVVVEQPIDASEETREGGKTNISKGKQGGKSYRASMRGKEAATGRVATPPSSPSGSRRSYGTSSVSSSFPPPSVESWRYSVERNNKACEFLTSLSRGCGGSALRHLGAPVSDSISHFPALRKLCRLSYERRKQHKTAWSFQSSVKMPANAKTFHLGLKSILGAQHWRANVVEVNCRIKNQCKTTPWCSFQGSVLPTASQPRVRGIISARRPRTNFGETNSRLAQKPPLQQASALLSRLLPLLRRR